MPNERMLTRVKNLVETRRLPYIPPNGMIVNTNESIVVPGALETELYLAALKEIHDEYIHDLLTNRILVTTTGFGGGGSGGDYFTTTLGDGTSTVFVIDAGFATENAQVYLFDNFGGGPIFFFDKDLASPGPTQITLTLTPAPATGRVAAFVFPP